MRHGTGSAPVVPSNDELRQDTDGYLARYDRVLSIALSRRLVPTSVTPNQITTAGLILGMAGALLLSRADYPRQVLGAFLLWICCILDGCDGEVARLKGLASPWGGRYDVIADNIVHVTIFMAIAARVNNTGEGFSWMAPSVLMLVGVLASMVCVWRLILSKPEMSRTPSTRAFERIASRDFIYIVLALTLIKRLEWFVWGAAVGSHIFWIALWWTARRGRKLA